ncbi:type IV pilus twitching motility protein PilT [Thermoclostridium stercorarium]|uniref:type IV pilus twitching motility protein PilT n=1 Tax=Thermoclostridium stercorarium TaxID=1510 RepID=UPI002249847F|nr:type IV pilus twitching motility protein PilT [Thermoclostridium stercorarium]UZQ86768.1 type IV pilus twitching motility protein PilT [Thermoclostridium stercorarium]
MNINEYLQKAVEMDASDLHICAGLPVVIRKHGSLFFIDDHILTGEDCLSLVKQLLNDSQFAFLEEEGEIDFAYMLSGVGRFRVNAFRQRGTYAIAIRVIPSRVPKISELGLPDILYSLAERQRGLVLITGPTGSGKSTTLAAMIDHINSTKRCHIVTIEDPIEYLHKHNKSVINQREIGSDTKSYSNALRAVLREDPDVILIGEMRDLETISIALTAAETGHLVLSTLHTLGAAKTVDRIIDVFPPHQQGQVRSQLSTVLQGIVSQQLIKKADNAGRVVATEVMIVTPAIANMIRESRTYQINSSIHTGGEYGMHSMDACIASLYKRGLITYENACQYAMDPVAMKKLIALE